MVFRSFMPLVVFMCSVAVFFQNCGDTASFSQGEKNSTLVDDRFDPNVSLNDQLGNGEAEDYGVINEACSRSTPLQLNKTIEFPHPGKVCEWEKNGNLGRKDKFFQARIEQSVGLGLPAGAVICAVKFDFPEQRYRYDDYFALLLNKSVIAAGYDFEDYLNPHYFGLLEYDWLNIRGIPMNFGSAREQIYCPKIEGAQSSCEFPGHDTAGKIKLDYDEKFIRSVMSTGVPQDHFFTLVTFGDNNQSDGEFDCSHSDIEFDVTVDYVLTQ